MTKVDFDFSRAEYRYKASSILAIILGKIFINRSYKNKYRTLLFNRFRITIAIWSCANINSFSCHFLFKFKNKAYRQDIEYYE